MITVAGAMASCNDYLDREPMSQITPSEAFNNATQLGDYANELYADILPGNGDSYGSGHNYSFGIAGIDEGTDNQVGVNAADRYTLSRWKVPQTESDNWKFEMIYRCNFFFSNVDPLYGSDINGSQNKIGGDLNEIKHYIGEMYFLRAVEYFNRYQKFGDFPIITVPLSDDINELREAARRKPRTEVAKFILSDLDKAITLLGAQDMRTSRINKDAALLMKSRVALFEASWLKNFSGTAFVPGTSEWPGKKYYPNYKVDTKALSDSLFRVCMEAAKQVGDKYKGQLTVNTGEFQQDPNGAENPFFNMYAQEDLSSVPEVLLWRDYARNIEGHNVNAAAGRGNYRIGLTAGLVNNFLMKDGLPVYKHVKNPGSNYQYAEGDGYYAGDKTLADVRKNRDPRLSIFLKEPGQKNVIFDLDNAEGTEAVEVEPYPLITQIGDQERAYATGYAIRKGGSLSRKYYANGSGYTAAVCYRAAEALLNYMEACVELNGSVDGTASEYWQAIRNRAGVDPDFMKTVNNTDMNEEAKLDWGAYSGGQLISPLLYNVRRERRSELMAEGLRYMDLIRWRAMDQMVQTPYHVEGFHLWNTPMQQWYDASELIADGTTNAIVSAQSISEYLRPFERNMSLEEAQGLKWRMAHYLYPIMVKQLQLTSTTGNVGDATIYQNPYWPTVADQTATK